MLPKKRKLHEHYVVGEVTCLQQQRGKRLVALVIVVAQEGELSEAQRKENKKVAQKEITVLDLTAFSSWRT